MWKLDNDPMPDPKERGGMRVKVLGDNCVPEVLASAGNIPSPNADNGCCYYEQSRENNSQDILSSTHRIVLLYVQYRTYSTLQSSISILRNRWSE